MWRGRPVVCATRWYFVAFCWTAIYAFSACVVVTVLVSLVTRPRADHELKGLVYSLTERVRDTQSQWYMRPATLGIVVLVGTLALNLLFW